MISQNGVALAGVEDQEQAGRVEHSYHRWPRAETCKVVEAGEDLACSLSMLEFPVMEPPVFKLTLCRFLIKKQRPDEMHEAER